MEFGDYRGRCDRAEKQLNVLALVGNGFDIQVLHDLGVQGDTCYESFYYFLKMRKFNKGNCIFRVMKECKREGRSDWSDIEEAIQKLVNGEYEYCKKNEEVNFDELAKALSEIQNEFSEFLNQLVTPKVLNDLGKLARGDDERDRLSLISFQNFLGDLLEEDFLESLSKKEYCGTNVHSKVDHYTVFNFHFINFNYTFLFDDFIYLDQEQFEPLVYRHSGCNISFYPNPHDYRRFKYDLPNAETVYSAYLVTHEPIHPHGMQTIPRSLLFGIDTQKNDMTKGSGEKLRLTKSYWAQNEIKYAPLIDGADCFIIFGTSLGATDGWWWRRIIERVKEERRTDVLLYWRVEKGVPLRGKKHEVLKKFAEAAGYEYDDDSRSLLSECVRVILYDDETKRAWLNTNCDNVPDWASDKQDWRL